VRERERRKERDVGEKFHNIEHLRSHSALKRGLPPVTGSGGGGRPGAAIPSEAKT
jgi:hypothetical protein